MNYKQRAVRIGGGLLVASSLGLVPVTALANHHEAAPMAAHAGQAGTAGASHGPAAMKAPAAPGMAGHDGMDDHAGPAAHRMAAHAAPMAEHRPMAKKPVDVKKDSGKVEGGAGASDNDGGTIAGDDAPAAHAHGDNQGGGIH